MLTIAEENDNVLDFSITLATKIKFYFLSADLLLFLYLYYVYLVSLLQVMDSVFFSSSGYTDRSVGQCVD